MAEVLDPARRIVDPHHHLWSGDGRGPYLLEDLYADVRCGHNVVQTMFVECRTHYRSGGPEHLRPVGQTEWVAAIADASARASAHGPGPEIAGIVAFADLTLGPRLEEVLDAHAEAAGGRLRGFRYSLAHGTHRSGTENAPGPAPAGLAAEEPFRDGVRLLGRRGLTYESWHFHYQMDEFIALARSVPDTLIILDHFGTPLGVGRWRGRRAEVFAEWKASMAEAAACPNMAAKLGGMAMFDNGFGWDARAEPVTAEEFAAAQRDYYLHAIDCFGAGALHVRKQLPGGEGVGLLSRCSTTPSS